MIQYGVVIPVPSTFLPARQRATKVSKLINLLILQSNFVFNHKAFLEFKKSYDDDDDDDGCLNQLMKKSVPDIIDVSNPDPSPLPYSDPSPPSLSSPSPSSGKLFVWPGFLSSIFDSHASSEKRHSRPIKKKDSITTTSLSCNTGAWRTAVKRVMNGTGAMRRLQERVLGTCTTTSLSTSNSDIYLLGQCYQVQEESPDLSKELACANRFEAFQLDFSSRILVTYRKGFCAFGDSKYTTDQGWGCMLRSSQMLVAQALLFHRLGRAWRKPSQGPMDREYVEILELFGDSVTSAFSIHNLLQAGKAYGLAAGLWVGPYAMCRSWETLARTRREESDIGDCLLPMALYIVSGEDGERGGAPVLCIQDASKHCYEFSQGRADWAPILLLVPLVLGLEKINPRYIPSLRSTFCFPQSLGILGGKPGSSTYIVGVQDEKAIYLDPHEVQQTIDFSGKNLELDTSSYHCNVVRHMPLDSIDSSLAIGFYCRDKDDFDDFCSRASQLARDSDGAPLFTVSESPLLQNQKENLSYTDTLEDNEMSDAVAMCGKNEDDWQLL